MISTFRPRSGFAFPGRSLRAMVTFCAAVLLLSITACHQVIKDPKDPRFIVAEGKDWTITRAQLDNQISLMLRQNGKTLQDIEPAKKPMVETGVLKNMVVEKLILARAATLPLKDVTKDEDAAMAELKGHFPSQADFDAQLKPTGLTMADLKEQIHKKIVIRKTLEAEAFRDTDPSDAEVNDFYLKNKDRLTQPDKIRASRIIVMVDAKATPAEKAAKKKKIDQAHARVMKGEDFSKVAGETTEDAYSKPKGGDIGYFQKGENEANFDDVAFATKLGQVSLVFETPMGYEFLKVTDVHPGGGVSIGDARATIAQYLRQHKREQAVNDYAKKLLADGNVTFHIVQVSPDQIPGATNITTPSNVPASGASH